MAMLMGMRSEKRRDASSFRRRDDVVTKHFLSDLLSLDYVMSQHYSQQFFANREKCVSTIS